MLKIIAAHDSAFLIGNKNKLPWKVEEDIEHFRNEIKGKIIVLGRITYESLLQIKDKLDVSKIIVLTSNLNYDPKDDKVVVFHKVFDILRYSQDNEIYICGGSKIYEEFLPYVDQMIITEIKGRYEGDSYFPLYNKNDFKLIKEKKLSDQATVKYLNHLKKESKQY
ncbi:Dihydrofolate reductase [Candidatus Hepatoplasma crinochetorum Av]|uniref:dihydrofolate reductase n=1 Tax=Candidatus Hepatoplasma crinochetorum Av TaxID=1427984 RepID=W8GMH8_9MOLU|nr:dihydrofolate reductase [Candidatus Hepatoplasma crinochetorum]AHK22231.1 Dihydrofolate reductase [Candidatus Hepatoplasma crinochetorum Av]